MTFSTEKQLIFNSIMQDLQKEFAPANDGDIPMTTVLVTTPEAEYHTPALDIPKFAEKYGISESEMTDLKTMAGIIGFGGNGLYRSIVFFVSAWNLWDKYNIGNMVLDATQKEFAIYRVLYMRNR